MLASIDVVMTFFMLFVISLQGFFPFFLVTCTHYMIV